ncbi:MAG TPA: hypothetical protein VNA66_03695 [Gammaproteobacteria bacterium]|jgi:uncharacterized protein (DUF2336 family)|nr:hypothetical protein [Gammaproteobacteria bacterium]
MKPTIRAKRTNALDDDDLRQLSDLSFSSVIADIASSEQRDPKSPKRSQRELDLESTHTDRTINELLAGAFSASEPGPEPEPRVTLSAKADPAGDATEDLIAPDVLFPELTLKD